MMSSTLVRLALLVASVAAQAPPSGASAGGSGAAPELKGCVEKAATPGEQNAFFNTFLDLLYSKDAAKRDVNKAIDTYYSSDIEDSSPRVDHKPGTMIVASLAQVAGTLGGIVNNLNVTEVSRSFDFVTGIGSSVVIGQPPGPQTVPYLRRTLTDKYIFGKGSRGACIHVHDDVMTCENVTPNGKVTAVSCMQPPGGAGAPSGPAPPSGGHGHARPMRKY